MSYKPERIAIADIFVVSSILVVGLKYDSKKNRAPVLVYKDRIKGFAGYYAKYINKIVENAPLTRMIYANMKVDEEIPRELYQAVADSFFEVAKRN